MRLNFLLKLVQAPPPGQWDVFCIKALRIGISFHKDHVGRWGKNAKMKYYLIS